VLHSVAGAGANGKHQDLDANQVFALFMTYSFDLRALLADDTVVYNR
jgi:hypothetical protein